MARRASTHFSYEQRINKILNAVSADPARVFSLEELAGIASPLASSIYIGYSAP